MKNIRMVMYERNFDRNRRIYFLIKEEKVFIEYMEVLKNSLTVNL